MAQDTAGTPNDYRESHLGKGTTYDAALASAPFDAYMAREEDAFLQRTIPQLFPHGLQRYLDFACGTGRIAKAVSPFAREAVGVDVSESMVEQARVRCPSMSFTIADLTTEHPPLGTFDLVTSFRFFGNAQDELRMGALAAIHRLLNDDGYFVFNNHRNPLSLLAMRGNLGGALDLSHFRLRRLLRDAGFRIVASRAIGAWILRHRMAEAPVLESQTARVFERLCRGSLFVPVSPDAIIVAQKRPGASHRTASS